jgi:hypothetical protein
VFDTVATEMEAALATLKVAAARGRPVATAETRLMEVPDAMAGLFPDRGVRRGSTMVIEPARGGSSLALALAAEVTRSGGWAAAVGLPSLGLVAAAEMGVDLARLALVPRPGGQWTAVVAALIDGVDLLVVGPEVRARPADARRLMARVRERGAVMALLDAGWPESPDLRVQVLWSEWDGLGQGYGRLRARRVEVLLSGRRAASREKRLELWLPGAGGELLAVAPPARQGGRGALVS